jgi:hypothetical protein
MNQIILGTICNGEQEHKIFLPTVSNAKIWKNGNQRKQSEPACQGKTTNIVFREMSIQMNI